MRASTRAISAPRRAGGANTWESSRARAIDTAIFWWCSLMPTNGGSQGGHSVPALQKSRRAGSGACVTGRAPFWVAVMWSRLMRACAYCSENFHLGRNYQQHHQTKTRRSGRFGYGWWRGPQKSSAPVPESGGRGARACHTSSRGRWGCAAGWPGCAPCMAVRLRVTWYALSTW